MADLDRRKLLGGAALCLAACPAIGAEGFGMETSPRIIRLRALFARLTEICEAPTEAFTDADLNAVCDEIYAIGDTVWASPVQGWTDILERALVAHYWFREDDPKSTDVRASRELISAVLEYAPAA